MGSESNVKLLSSLVSLCLMQLVSVEGAPKVPCYFIFGDSLSDSGNNNRLTTFARANYPPYGIDFPNKTPTGRFTNGLTTADIIGLPPNSHRFLFRIHIHSFSYNFLLFYRLLINIFLNLMLY